MNALTRYIQQNKRFPSIILSGSESKAMQNFRQGLGKYSQQNFGRVFVFDYTGKAAHNLGLGNYQSITGFFDPFISKVSTFNFIEQYLMISKFDVNDRLALLGVCDFLYEVARIDNSRPDLEMLKMLCVPDIYLGYLEQLNLNPFEFKMRVAEYEEYGTELVKLKKILTALNSLAVSHGNESYIPRPKLYGNTIIELSPVKTDRNTLLLLQCSDEIEPGDLCIIFDNSDHTGELLPVMDKLAKAVLIYSIPDIFNGDINAIRYWFDALVIGLHRGESATKAAEFLGKIRVTRNESGYTEDKRLSSMRFLDLITGSNFSLNTTSRSEYDYRIPPAYISDPPSNQLIFYGLSNSALDYIYV